MSDGLSLTITTLGLAAAIKAKENGIKAVLKWVSVGDAAYTPSKAQKVLQSEKARVEFGEFKDLSGTSIQAAAKFSGDDEYAIREIGFWLDDGTLFGVISAPDTTLNYKAAGAHCIQPFTLNLSALPTDAVTVEVGTENLNILIDAEFAILAKTQVDQMHLAIKQEWRLLEIEKQLR
ncbi:hypothetical protein SAMN04488136_1648 [Vibrio xiamenensis]|uniref:Phage tail fibre protein N-terminal domain-containing protein n=1 Tax=Vibrio xiamenensis TaxID=861298 RepID=A0A1G8HUV7_9VIBR|nr:phage tail protein [Vibrio xiamenensis]SDI10291.1 hypothetical protein SAMN04488136_1648 [Vibrio xiamenensis]